VIYEDDPLAAQLAFRVMNGLPMPIPPSCELIREQLRRRGAHRPLNIADLHALRDDLEEWNGESLSRRTPV
jgi:hypothetical protein